MTVDTMAYKAAGLTQGITESKKYLSKYDALSLLGILDASTSCKKEEDFRDLLKYFSSLFDAEFSLCFLATLTEEGLTASIEVLNANFPLNWIEQYMSKGYYRIDPVVTEHFRNYEVQYWNKTYTDHRPPMEILRHAHRFGLIKGYSCGARNSSINRPASLFYFSGDSLEERPRTEIILKYSVPFLHEALKRVIRSSSWSSGTILTLREKEILGCIRDGKADTAIALCLKISEHTVKFHVKNILYKLEVSSRYHALAIALKNNLIEG
jgi:DNA-binding CsgD family transcriptional regulator